MPTEKITDQVTHVVIDASIAVKLFSEEPGSRQAEILLEKCFQGNLKLSAPDLLIYEAANALGKGKKFNSAEIAEALNDLFNSRIQFFSPDKMLTTSAAEIMTRYDLSFYDASYVALAEMLRVPLLSADTRGHKNIPGIKTLDLL